MPKKSKPVRRPNTHKLHLAPILIAFAVLILGIVIGSSWQRKSETPMAMDMSHSESKDTTLLFVQTAASGSFTSANSAQGMYILQLTNVRPSVLMFTDRPRRQVGSVNMDAFLQKAWDIKTPDNYATDPPNAVLMTHDTNEGHEEAVVITLSKPSYDAAAGTLTYMTKILGRTDASQLGVINDKDVSTFPDQFNDPALFIDDFGGAGFGF